MESQGGATVSPQAKAMWGKFLIQETWHPWSLQERDNTGTLSVIPRSLLPEVSQVSLSLYDFGTPRAAFPLPEPMVSSCKQEFICCPFERMPEFPIAIYLTQKVISTHFHSHMLCALLLPALVLWARETDMRLRPPYSSGGPLQLRYPIGFSTITCGWKASLFHISAFPTVSTWLPLYILSYTTSVQLVFR